MPKVHGGMPVSWVDAMGTYGPERMDTAAQNAALAAQVDALPDPS